MSKEIKRWVLIFFCAFLMFTLAVVIAEIVNYKNIITTYPESGQQAVPGVVPVNRPSEEAFDFQRSKVTTWLLRLFLSFVVPAFFIFSRLSSSIASWASKKAKRWIVVILLYFAVYSVIELLIYLPLDIYTGFIRMHHYGLSNQVFSQWLSEMIKSFIVNTALAAAVVWIPFLIIKKFPRRWWLYIGLLLIPYLMFASFLQPVAIDPVFNEFKPIEDANLSGKIDNLLNKTYIENCQVYQVDKSKETNLMNAYMTGVFNTKRIVLWDTTINYLNYDEILGIVAHEMGHYLMGHIWKSIVMSGIGSILLLFLIYKMCHWFLKKSKGRYGFNQLSEVAALPLLVLMLNVVLFFTAPLTNAYSRSMEVEADRFELELTQNNFAAATSTVKLHQQSLTMPQPGIIYMLWTYDHPTYKSRVDFANNYRPWENGEPLRYERFIRKGK